MGTPNRNQSLRVAPAGIFHSKRRTSLSSGCHQVATLRGAGYISNLIDADVRAGSMHNAQSHKNGYSHCLAF